jgi:deoxyribonuclease IV
MKALARARELGCEAVQLFSGNPNGWAVSPLDPEIAATFSALAAECDIRPIVLHTPYLLNLASPDDVIWAKSVGALAHAVGRAGMLGAEYVVTHIGSHKGAGYEYGIGRIQAAVRAAVEAGGATVALELGSGAGNSIGSRFEHIADILAGLADVEERVGICIDTAHLYGSGYDISTAHGVEAMMDDLKRFVGIEKLKVVHLNDTLMALGSHADRHHHVGKGNVGVEGFRALVNYPGTEDLPGIIETPGDGKIDLDGENLGALRGLRASAPAT